MARHNNRYRIPAGRSSDGPCCLRIAQVSSYVKVSFGLAEGDAKQNLPYTSLERCSCHVQGNRKVLSHSRKVLVELLLCLHENRVSMFFDQFTQADARRVVVLPEDGNERFVVCHQLQLADRRIDHLVSKAHGSSPVSGCHESPFRVRICPGGPQVLRGIGSPRTPGLGTAEQACWRDVRTIHQGSPLKKPQVRGWKRV